MQDLLSEFDPLSRPPSTASTSRTPLFSVPVPSTSQQSKSPPGVREQLTSPPLHLVQDDPLDAHSLPSALGYVDQRSLSSGPEMRTRRRQEALRQHLKREPFENSRPPTPLVAFDDPVEISDHGAVQAAGPVAAAGPSRRPFSPPRAGRSNGFQPELNHHSTEPPPRARSPFLKRTEDADFPVRRGTPSSSADLPEEPLAQVRLRGFRNGMLRALDEDLADAVSFPIQQSSDGQAG